MRCLSALFFVLCLLSCTTEQASPEEVVHQYANLINKGRLDDAKAYCTPAGVVYLDVLYELMSDSETATDTLPIEIRELNCTMQTDSLVLCQSTEFDGFEIYQAEYHLRLTNEGWKVDQPVAEGKTSSSEEIVEPEEEKN